jgi:hypothetical protein
MFNSAKRSQDIEEGDIPQERRKSADRRVSADKIRFPFKDDDCKLVMKDRRSLERRTSDTSLIKSPLKIAIKLFKK